MGLLTTARKLGVRNCDKSLYFSDDCPKSLARGGKGTIHLRRRHALGGRGQKFAKFADG